MRGVLAILAVAVLGCSASPRAPLDPLSLRTAKVVAISVAPEGTSAICPGAHVPLAVDVVVVRRDETTEDVVHARRKGPRDSIFDPATLAITSDQGTIDAHGIFHASADPRLSAAGFTVQVRPPNGDAVSVRMPVSYDCVHSAGVDARSANESARGVQGDTMDRPVKAARGGPGGFGGRGDDAPNVVVYVTWVKTPEHAKLLAALVDFGDQTLTLAPADAPLRLAARGGNGGRGGRGGQGGDGITWCKEKRVHRTRLGGHYTECVERSWSVPGDGGPGGDGGDGGAGGRLEVHVDRRHPELVSSLVMDVSGGAAGLAGASGAEGETNPRFEWSKLPERFGKMLGMPGEHGTDGHPGKDGTMVVVLDDVSERFAGLGAIEPL